MRCGLHECLRCIVSLGLSLLIISWLGKGGGKGVTTGSGAPLSQSSGIWRAGHAAPHPQDTACPFSLMDIWCLKPGIPALLEIDANRRTFFSAYHKSLSFICHCMRRGRLTKQNKSDRMSCRRTTDPHIDRGIYNAGIYRIIQGSWLCYLEKDAAIIFERLVEFWQRSLRMRISSWFPDLQAEIWRDPRRRWSFRSGRFSWFTSL